MAPVLRSINQTSATDVDRQSLTQQEFLAKYGFPEPDVASKTLTTPLRGVFVYRCNAEKAGRCWRKGCIAEVFQNGDWTGGVAFLQFRVQFFCEGYTEEHITHLFMRQYLPSNTNFWDCPIGTWAVARSNANPVTMSPVHPKFMEVVDPSKIPTCPVCLKPHREHVMHLACGGKHTLCRVCYFTWKKACVDKAMEEDRKLKMDCPLCKRPVREDEVICLRLR